MSQGFIGIDPGLGGAVAVLMPARPWLDISDTPTVVVGNGRSSRQEYLPRRMYELLARIKGFSADVQFHAALEAQNAFPGQGVTSSFRLGLGLGLWEMALAAAEIPYTKVRPNQWKPTMMAGMGTEKQASCLRAEQLFPRAAELFSRPALRGSGKVYLHDRAEALLLAEWMKRKTLGN